MVVPSAPIIAVGSRSRGADWIRQRTAIKRTGWLPLALALMELPDAPVATNHWFDGASGGKKSAPNVYSEKLDDCLAQCASAVKCLGYGPAARSVKTEGLLGRSKPV
jgi:hypothetical protein